MPKLIIDGVMEVPDGEFIVASFRGGYIRMYVD